MFYGAPVTAPMVIPPEAPRSSWRPDDPKLKEMPSILDAGLDGLRLQNTQAKALPGLPVIDSGTGARQREAAELARDMGIVFNITKRQLARSRGIARKRNRINERKAKNFGKR